MFIVSPVNAQNVYSVSPSGNKMVTIVGEAITFSKIFSGE